MSFVLKVVEQYSVEGLMLKMKLQHLHHLVWIASSLEETLMLVKIVGRRRGIKGMRWWDGVTNSMDMSLRKLHKIVKDREVCSVAIHVITKSQTWLSNWRIPMRTEGPGKPLALVGVVSFRWQARLPILWCSSLNPRQGTQDIECVTKHCFLKKQRTVLSRSESFDWVCALDFTEVRGRKLEWAESANTRWPAAGGGGMW